MVSIHARIIIAARAGTVRRSVRPLHTQISLLDHRRRSGAGLLRLDQLHMVFQEVMGWTNSHLHRLRIGDALYGMHFDDWPEEELHETEFKLADVAHAAVILLPRALPGVGTVVGRPGEHTSHGPEPLTPTTLWGDIEAVFR